MAINEKKPALEKGHPYHDILSQLNETADSSIQVVFSRPPIIQRILATASKLDFLTAYQEHIRSLNDIWRECRRVLKEDGIMWIMCDNYFYDGQLIRLPFNLAQQIQSSGFLMKNIIIWYNLNAERFSRDLVNRYSYVLFFAKSKEYKFNIDAIREPHIWKDVEWGGGRRSRYHPKGKNPSNVWLKTEAQKGKTLKHIPLSLNEVISRCILVSSDEKDHVLNIFAENAPVQKIAKEVKRIPKAIFSKVQYSSRLKKEIGKKNESAAPIQRDKKFVRALYFKSSEKMEEVPNSSVQLIITSPPYWGLRDYGVRKQIGFGESYKEYLERLGKVWRECYRVLNPTGSLWININKRIIEGNMLLIPEDIAQTVCNLGFFLKEIVIWHKPIFVPTTGPKNFTDRHEYVLFFTKSKEDFLFRANEIKCSDYLHPGSEKIGNVWKIHRRIGNIGKPIEVHIAERKVKHTAVYPNELVERIILLCSNEGEIVLDPFAGSGTTLVVANKLARQWIGYEINQNFKAIIEWRLQNEGCSLSP